MHVGGGLKNVLPDWPITKQQYMLPSSEKDNNFRYDWPKRCRGQHVSNWGQHFSEINLLVGVPKALESRQKNYNAQKNSASSGQGIFYKWRRDR